MDEKLYLSSGKKTREFLHASMACFLTLTRYLAQAQITVRQQYQGNMQEQPHPKISLV